MLVAGCTNAGPKPDVVAARALPAAIAGDAATVVAGNNQFAFDVYSQLPAGQNTFFSPFSIAAAFSMLDAGAAGNTDAQIRAALHATLPGDAQHAAWSALLTSIDTGRDYGNYTLGTADRLFGQQGFPFLQSYLDITKNDYEAELESLDFATDPDGSRATINQWVSEQTDGKIPELFPQGTIDSSTVLALANAILFKGTWLQEFDPSQTAAGTFHVAGGADVQPQMMHATETVTLGQVSGGTLGLLPFAGSDLAMGVIVPDDPDGLPAVEASLTSAALGSAIAAAVSTDDTIVALPKLTLTEAYKLNDLMAALGVVDAFSPAADFSGIDGRQDLSVQTALHKATLTVDEQGAEATAATGIGLGGAVGPGEQPMLVADHSFLIFIYDNVTGSILFIGRVQDPTQAS